jgi:hypothetical protein
LLCLDRCIVESAILRVICFGLCPAEIQQQLFHPFGLILTILVSFPVRFHKLTREIELFDALRTPATPLTLSLRFSSLFTGCFCLFLSGVLTFSSYCSCAIPYWSDAGCVFFISPGYSLYQIIVN